MLTDQELQTLRNLGHDDAAQEIEGLRTDALRFRKLAAAAVECFVYPVSAKRFVSPDLRTHWRLPRLISGGTTVGGHVSFADAVDNLPGQASTLDAGAEKE